MKGFEEEFLIWHVKGISGWYTYSEYYLDRNDAVKRFKELKQKSKFNLLGIVAEACFVTLPTNRD